MLWACRDRSPAMKAAMPVSITTVSQSPDANTMNRASRTVVTPHSLPR